MNYVTPSGPHMFMEGFYRYTSIDLIRPLCDILQQHLQLQFAPSTIPTLSEMIRLETFPYHSPSNHAGALLTLANPGQHHFGLTHSPSERLALRLIPYRISISPAHRSDATTGQHQAFLVAAIMPHPHVNVHNYTETGSEALLYIRGTEQIPADGSVQHHHIPEVQSILATHYVLLHRCFSELPPLALFFILPRRLSTDYPNT